MKTKHELMETLVMLYLDNPCLSSDIDYEDEKARIKHYKAVTKKMTKQELIKEIENFEN
jgi:hypothetical protein